MRNLWSVFGYGSFTGFPLSYLPFLTLLSFFHYANNDSINTETLVVSVYMDLSYLTYLTGQFPMYDRRKTYQSYKFIVCTPCDTNNTSQKAIPTEECPLLFVVSMIWTLARVSGGIY